MTMTKTDPREITLDILLEVLEEGRLGHLVLNQALLKYQYLEKQDRSFITKLTEGTLERLILLDAALDRFSKTKTEKEAGDPDHSPDVSLPDPFYGPGARCRRLQ